MTLRPRSFAVLKLLSQKRGLVVTKSEIMDAVWDDAIVTEDSLTQCVADIRRALGDVDHRLVRNVSRRGYLLASEARSETASFPDAVQQSGIGATALGSPGPRPELAGPMPDRPSIAVLPFKPDRPDEPARMFAEGISTEIINDLARNSDMRVIAWFSSFALFAAGLDIPAIGEKLRVRYLVDGSVRRDDERMHVDVRLIDSHTGTVAWAEKFTLKAEDIPRARNELVEKIAATLHSSLRRTEERSALARPPRDLETYELVLRGIALKHQFNRKATAEARALLIEATRRDHDYAPAWLYLAFVNAIDCVLQLTGEWTLARSDEIVAQFEHAIQLDPTLPTAYQGLSFLCRYKGDMEGSLTLIRRAVELGPSDADNFLFLGVALIANGHAEEALTETEKAIELNPIIPPEYSFYRAEALWANGRYASALDSAEDCLRKAPEFVACQIFRILALVGLERQGEARSLYARAIENDAAFAHVVQYSIYRRAPELAQRLRQMMRQAGWIDPEAPQPANDVVMLRR